MNAYKLGNIIKKRMLEQFDNSQIRKQRLSIRYLKELFTKCELLEWVELDYCCRGEDTNCWVDEKLSWTSPSPINSRFRRFKRQLNRICEANHINIGKRHMFIGEDDMFIVICIPLRDITSPRFDTWLTFRK